MAAIALLAFTCLSGLFFKAYDTRFLPWNDQRDDRVTLSDRLLDVLPQRNTNVEITILSGFNIISFAIVSISRFSWLLYARFLFSFTTFHICRCICMFFCPLNAPCSQILADRVLECITGHQSPHIHDCFFSGHTGLCVLFWCFSESQAESWFWGAGGFATAYYLLIGRFHYTIDIIIAVMVAYNCWQLSTILITG